MGPIIDYSFLDELSGGEAQYKYDVIGIFLDTVDTGINNLEQLVAEMKDMDALYKQAHALKSSASIVKVRDMYERLAKIEEWGRADVEHDKIRQLFKDMMETYREAHPLLVAEREKNKPVGE